PLLAEDDHSEPAARRRRHNAIRARRPKFLVRRRAGDLLNPANLHQGEREISRGTKTCRVGKAQACPPLSQQFRERWWARRKRAFAHPTHQRTTASTSS